MLSDFVSLPANKNTDISGPKEVLLGGAPRGGFVPKHKTGNSHRLLFLQVSLHHERWNIEMDFFLGWACLGDSRALLRNITDIAELNGGK